MLYAGRKTSKLRGNLNPLPITDEPAFPCLQAPSCSSYYPSIPAFLAMNLFMQWQVDQSVNRKLPPLPPPSSCMAAALIGNNGICCWLPAAAGDGQLLLFPSAEQGIAPLPLPQHPEHPQPRWIQPRGKAERGKEAETSWGLREAISTDGWLFIFLKKTQTN